MSEKARRVVKKVKNPSKMGQKGLKWYYVLKKGNQSMKMV
jgi:hypothetical protein